MAQVDALDESAVEKHISDTIRKAGGIDISFNTIGLSAFNVHQQNMQVITLTEIHTDSFYLHIITYTRSHFLTARASARHMVKKQSGVILMHTPEPARLGAPRSAARRTRRVRPAERARQGALECDAHRRGGDAASFREPHGRPGRFQLAAAVQSAHAARRFVGRTDWAAIVELYDALLALTGSVVVAINRAVALAAHVNGPLGAAEGLAALDTLDGAQIAGYQPYWAARAALLARTGSAQAAAEAYRRAIGLESDPAVRCFLQAELSQV